MSPSRPRLPRRRSALAAAILLLVFGGLATLVAVYRVLLSGGPAVGDASILLLFGVAELSAGMLVLQRHAAGRLVGMVLGAIAAAVSIIGVLSSVGQEKLDAATGTVSSGIELFSLVVSAIVLVAHTAISLLLIRWGGALPG
ncbi:MAG TPA: hypothetical protein VE754_01120 [Actinomycetota bacterium]|jgi:hypothetical protein|nr:hypothetical protein [Actinomycetota bacterium]